MTQTALATVQGLTLGVHTARVNAVVENGDRKSSQWRFRVSPNGDNGGIPTAGPQPTPGLSVTAALETGRFVPAVDGRVLANGGDMKVSVDVSGTQPLSGAQIVLDGKQLDTKIETVSGAGTRTGTGTGAGAGASSSNLYRISATSPPVQAGRHTVIASVVSSSGNSHSSQWTFTALVTDADHAYFNETGYFVTQPFLSYWQQNGGLALFGYPISDLLQKADSATGEVYIAQYFERARFEQHHSLGNQVILGRLGALVHPPGAAVQPKAGYQFFPETGHNVSPTFLKYWNDHGGLAVFGYPITEERIEKNPIDGKEYTVQYFERNRFELHPEQAGTLFEVQLGLLGTQAYNQEYGR
jgi:hypothetical protein